MFRNWCYLLIKRLKNTYNYYILLDKYIITYYVTFFKNILTCFNTIYNNEKGFTKSLEVRSLLLKPNLKLNTLHIPTPYRNLFMKLNTAMYINVSNYCLFILYHVLHWMRVKSIVGWFLYKFTPVYSADSILRGGRSHSYIYLSDAPAVNI